MRPIKMKMGKNLDPIFRPSIMDRQNKSVLDIRGSFKGDQAKSKTKIIGRRKFHGTTLT